MASTSADRTVSVNQADDLNAIFGDEHDIADESNNKETIIDYFSRNLSQKVFSSFAAFEQQFKTFMQRFNTIYVISGSCRSKYHHLRYEYVNYVCVYTSQKTASRSYGKRRVFSHRSGCKSRFRICRQNRSLRITSFNMEHNHEMESILAACHPVNRRLTSDDLSEFDNMINYNTPVSGITRCIWDRTGKIISPRQIHNRRHYLRSLEQRNVDSFCDEVNKHGRAKVVRDESGDITHFCFSNQFGIDLFARFPEVVNVDATHGTNKRRYPLYTLMVTDGMGYGRPVFYGFVRIENYDSLKTLFEIFKDFMCDCSKIRTIVSDKMSSQLRAANTVFGCDIQLCYFHVWKAVKSHTQDATCKWLFEKMATSDDENQFKSHLEEIHRRDSTFHNYLLKHWLPMTRSWAYHAQEKMVNFGNTTNNRLESSHHHLKKNLCHNDSLVNAAKKILDYWNDKSREFAVQLSYGCDRREVTNADTYVVEVVSRLTTYAAKRVMRHVDDTHAEISVKEQTLSEFEVKEGPVSFQINVESGRCNCSFYESHWLPCVHLLTVYRNLNRASTDIPIEKRWLANYYRPPQSLRPNVNFISNEDQLQAQIQMYLKAAKRLADIDAHYFRTVNEQLVHALHKCAENRTPSTSRDTRRQPRWKRSRPSKPICLQCSQPITEDGVECLTDGLNYHVQCADGPNCCVSRGCVLTPMTEDSHMISPPRNTSKCVANTKRKSVTITNDLNEPLEFRSIMSMNDIEADVFND